MEVRGTKISGKKLQSLRKRKLAMNARKFSEAADIGVRTLKGIESKAITNVDTDTLGGISKALGVPPEQALMMLSPDPLDSNVEPYSERPVIEVPTFDLAVAAGPWVSFPEAGEVHEDGAAKSLGIFRIRIRGDSMEKEYADGSMVEFRCLRQAGLIENGDRLEVGRDYYVQRMDDATFKRLDRIEDDELVFRAINRKKYPSPIRVQRDEIVRMAKAVAKVTLL